MWFLRVFVALFGEYALGSHQDSFQSHHLPCYTFQTCLVCGFILKDNRPSHGEKFVCQSCGYGEQADVVGAINIALRVLSKTQEENLKGLLVSQPNAPHYQVGGASSPPLEESN